MNQVVGCFVVEEGRGCLVGRRVDFVGGLDDKLDNKELVVVLSRLVVGDVSDLEGMWVIGFGEGLVWVFVVGD